MRVIQIRNHNVSRAVFHEKTLLSNKLIKQFLLRHDVTIVAIFNVKKLKENGQR